MKHKPTALIHAVARHVSAEGCQFVLQNPTVSDGQRLAVSLRGRPPVAGTVRWVLADRVGFAFDEPACKESQRELSRQSQAGRSLQLVPA